METDQCLLVIDDERAVREAIKDILDMVGISIIAAENGYEGLEKLEQHSDEIGGVLLDMKMPGLSGIDTLRAMRKIDPYIKVLISSGFNEDRIADDLLDEHTTDFLAKPYDLETLIQKVRALLEA